jgi:hypothetical protein
MRKKNKGQNRWGTTKEIEGKGKGGNLRGSDGRVNMIKIHCIHV